MLEHFANGDTTVDVAVEHEPDQIDAGLGHDVGDAQVVVHDLVDAIERVLLIDNSVK